MTIMYEWRCVFDNSEVNSLHAEGFGRLPSQEDWWTRVNR